MQSVFHRSRCVRSTPSIVVYICSRLDLLGQSRQRSFNISLIANMSKLQLLNVFVTERLSAAAVEIFGVVEKTIAEFQELILCPAEENERLRRLLAMVIKPEIKLHKVDFLELTPVVPPEQQNCEQEWSPSLGQEDPEPTQIKEEQQELRLSQEDPPQPSHLYQNQTVDDGERGILPIIITEEIKTDPDVEGYRVPEPTSDQPISVLPDCSAAVDKTYQCKQCGNSFTRKGHLTIHSRIHTGEKSYQCKQCGRCFNVLSNLKQHMRIHTGQKSYQCKECGKCFSRKCDLDRHTRIHTGERSFQCEDCGKAFNQKIELTFHMRVHTGQRPYSCPVCRKSYMALSHLRRHQSVHTGEKPHQCKECDKCFSYKGSLKLHMSTHTKGIHNITAMSAAKASA
ncbi:zinc finger and SCAN domain-containing protein 31-like [Salvelinus fontinalis]|uniref:zinc finger and SCAN domain-containing protein 31-like n=1 Tax=Salvelinus fontinalis TaxID=8038 RepID=UPI002484F5D3|nr:zinc finger and SCAN domain-containing protein 31-like [Salvelinus fontinalis]